MLSNSTLFWFLHSFMTLKSCLELVAKYLTQTMCFLVILLTEATTVWRHSLGCWHWKQNIQTESPCCVATMNLGKSLKSMDFMVTSALFTWYTLKGCCFIIFITSVFCLQMNARTSMAMPMPGDIAVNCLTFSRLLQYDPVYIVIKFLLILTISFLLFLCS